MAGAVAARRRGNLTANAWLTVALAALFGVQLTLHPQLAFPAFAVGLWLLRGQVGPFARVLVLLVAAVSALRGHRGIRDYLDERELVRGSIRASSRCGGEGQIVASPILRDGRFVLVVDASQLECDDTVPGRHRIRLTGAPDGLGRGDTVAFIAQLGPVAPPRQLELSDPIPRLAALGVVASGGALHIEKLALGSGWQHAIDRARAWVRRRIVATYSPRAEALGRALVLGENDLDPDEQLAFQRSGLSHLLAVSGTHLVFAVVSVVAALRALMLRVTWVAGRVVVARWVAPIGAIFALVYADFAGGSGSAWRAAWMLTALYLATALGRRLGGLRALAFSLVIGVLDNPLAGYDISFLLSALATSGLVVVAPSLKRAVEGIRWRPLRWFAEALTTTVAAMLPCIPLLLLLSPDITMVGILANVIAGPVGELAGLPLCLIHAVAAPVPWLEHGLALAGSGALLAVGTIAKVSAGVAWARVSLPPPTPEQFTVMAVTAMAMSSQLKARERVPKSTWIRRYCPAAVLGFVTAGCLVFLELVARRAGAPIGRLRVTAIDVGQGDSLLVDLPDGRLMLVDGGGAITGGPDPGQRVVLPLLRARRRGQIDIVVLTHPHPDHFGGLLAVMRALPIAEFWEAGDRDDGGVGDIAQLRRHLLQVGTRVRHLPDLCESFGVHRDPVIELLGPCPNVTASHHANDQSLVIRLKWGRHSVLLAGDAEATLEAELVAKHGTHLRADLLKIGHHGSKSSTTQAWLDAISPSCAIVSVGLRNRFGHPHPTTLARLKTAGVPLFRTDELGSIEWSSDGARLALRTATSGLASVR